MVGDEPVGLRIVDDDMFVVEHELYVEVPVAAPSNSGLTLIRARAIVRGGRKLRPVGGLIGANAGDPGGGSVERAPKQRKFSHCAAVVARRDRGAETGDARRRERVTSQGLGSKKENAAMPRLACSFSFHRGLNGSNRPRANAPLLTSASPPLPA